MDLSVAVVSWNTCALLACCVQSIYDTIEDMEFEIFVVDNASTDDSAAMVRDCFPKVQLIENAENVGFARANNQAVQQSVGRYILLLNSDAYVVKNAVEQMMRVMDARGDVGIVGVDLISPNGDPQLDHGSFPTLTSEIGSLLGLDKFHLYFPRHFAPGRFVETGWVSGACLMARRQMLEQIGLLDEGFFMFSEEVELCRRSRAAGWKVVHLPSARAVHVGGGSTGLTPERILRLYRGKLQYFAKTRGLAARRALLGAIWCATGLKVLVYTLLHGLSLGRVHRDVLWRAVAKGLVDV